jgi:hypothetical protein
MTPLIPATIIVAWLIAAFFDCAFVHGAQILRRQEVATLAVAEQDRVTLTTVTPTGGRAEELPKAA